MKLFSRQGASVRSPLSALTSAHVRGWAARALAGRDRTAQARDDAVECIEVGKIE